MFLFPFAVIHELEVLFSFCSVHLEPDLKPPQDSFLILVCLQETVKEKEQSLRKYEQEVDSLAFRNQQLFTRCEVLQSELSSAESSKKKNKVCRIKY